ncbi:MAG TPA: hypothetical protein VH144_00165 [Candidatus Saccharimonadales bacterium]|jgi:Tfp pilus assembly protein PilX|nr:hypothetical protein [Candidatus Saccharimonadales bacterium]
MPKFSAQSSQAGFVSIFTVIFFIILITVLTVGFLRIVGDEQRQSTDNDLTASALASAEAGVEDAKRALLLYKSTGDADLKAAFDAKQCNTLTSPVIANKLKSGQGALDTDKTSFLQAYTCVTVQLNTNDFQNTAVKGKSELIPLDAGGANFDSIKLSWHNSDTDGVPQNLAFSSLLPDVASWQQNGYPAFMRMEVIAVPSSFKLSDVNANAKTAYLVPGGASGQATMDLNGYDSRSADDQVLRQKSTPALVKCDKNAQPFVCNLNVNLTGTLAPAGQKLYLRLTSIYANTHFSVSLQQAGSTVQMYQVQPIVDSTGQANDVFRRVQARVDFSHPTVPEFSLESGDNICKDFEVSLTPADYKDNGTACTTP